MSLMYSLKSNCVAFTSSVELKSQLLLVAGGQRMHLCLRLPMKSCKPTRAKTARQNTVRIITSPNFFTDWMSAPTIVFKPEQDTEHRMIMVLVHSEISEQGFIRSTPYMTHSRSFKGQHTGNYSDCFKCSEYTERSECWHISKIDKLCDIPADKNIISVN